MAEVLEGRETPVETVGNEGNEWAWLPSGNFWVTARMDQGVRVWRPGEEHLDAGKV